MLPPTYLAAILKVLAHKLARTLQARHATKVIGQAFATFRTSEIVHTDPGSLGSSHFCQRNIKLRRRLVPHGARRGRICALHVRPASQAH